jgi:hypothetical protein
MVIAVISDAYPITTFVGAEEYLQQRQILISQALSVGKRDYQQIAWRPSMLFMG